MTTSNYPLHVLVSGASGFVAAWIVRTLLERGHHVRGTVRSHAKGDYLDRLFKHHRQRFEYVIVKDIQQDGAFDDAVKGMDAIIHTASPFNWDVDDPQELISPAVKGTTTILESVLKFAPNVKRVVITSSTVAVSHLPPAYDPPRSITFTEENWNDQSPALIAEMGRDAPSTHKYRASKVLAERAAWEFVDNHKSEINWDLVTLQPSYVFGPIIHQVSSPSSLNTSSHSFFTLLTNDPPHSPTNLTQSLGTFVDVRDVAWAHAEVLLTPPGRFAGTNKNAAFLHGKGRITLSAEAFTWQDVVDAITASSTPLPKSTPRGKHGAGAKTIHPVLIDSRRAREDLGLKFISISQTFLDTLESFRERGWVV